MLFYNIIKKLSYGLIPAKVIKVIDDLYLLSDSLNIIDNLYDISLSTEEYINASLVLSLLISISTTFVFYLATNSIFLVIFASLLTFFLVFHEALSYVVTNAKKINEKLKNNYFLAIRDYLATLLATNSNYQALRSVALNKYEYLSDYAMNNLSILLMNKASKINSQRSNSIKLGVLSDYLLVFSKQDYQRNPKMPLKQFFTYYLKKDLDDAPLLTSAHMSIVLSLFLFSFIFSIILFSITGLSMTPFFILLIPFHYFFTRYLEKRYLSR